MISDPQAFTSTAACYARYRPHYLNAPSFLLTGQFPLADVRALDLGCGPGTAAVSSRRRRPTEADPAPAGWERSAATINGRER